LTNLITTSYLVLKGILEASTLVGGVVPSSFSVGSTAVDLLRNTTDLLDLLLTYTSLPEGLSVITVEGSRGSSLLSSLYGRGSAATAATATRAGPVVAWPVVARTIVTFLLLLPFLGIVLFVELMLNPLDHRTLASGVHYF
jgi:hypothetical protein